MSVEVYGGGGGASLKLQSKIVTPSTEQQIVTPDNGIDGLSKVTVNPMPGGTMAAPTISAGGLITSKIEKGGYLNEGDSRTLQLNTQAAKIVVPTTSNQVAVQNGVYTTGRVDVQGDANLIADNIRSGVSIFGVAGAFQGETTISAGSAYKAGTDSETKIYISAPSGNVSLTNENVKNLNFGTGISCRFNSASVDFYAVKGNDGGWYAEYWFRDLSSLMTKQTKPISFGGHYILFDVTEIGSSGAFTFDSSQIKVTYAG